MKDTRKMATRGHFTLGADKTMNLSSLGGRVYARTEDPPVNGAHRITKKKKTMAILTDSTRGCAKLSAYDSQEISLTSFTRHAEVELFRGSQIPGAILFGRRSSRSTVCDWETLHSCVQNPRIATVESVCCANFKSIFNHILSLATK